MVDNKIGLADTVATMIGCVFCFVILFGFFGMGLMAADVFLGGDHRGEMGLLAAITLIWIYEHQTSRERSKALNERLDRLYAKAAGPD